MTVQASGVTVVVSFGVEMASDPPPVTVATLISGDVAVGAALTVTGIGGYFWP